jgi:hypothetical protein
VELFLSLADLFLKPVGLVLELMELFLSLFAISVDGGTVLWLMELFLYLVEMFQVVTELRMYSMYILTL